MDTDWRSNSCGIILSDFQKKNQSNQTISEGKQCTQWISIGNAVFTQDQTPNVIHSLYRFNLVSLSIDVLCGVF